MTYRKSRVSERASFPFQLIPPKGAALPFSTMLGLYSAALLHVAEILSSKRLPDSLPAQTFEKELGI
jgi:hypothetical protein